MIRLENVNKYFNKRKSNEIHVINNTSLELENKGLVTFLGNSGCGKTTLLNAIGGLDKVNSGKIFIDNEEITTRSTGKRDKIRNLNVGYIFQNYNLIEDATVFENVALVLKMMGIKNREEINKRVMYILERVGIERYKNRQVKMMSGGERQRVGIARALVKNPKIIIADEPTGNLDSRNTIEIMNIIKAISREKLVILVTHERDIAEFYSSRIIEIVDGAIAGDRENEHDGKLDYRMDSKLYLKDMAVQKEMSSDNVNVKFYSDSEEDIDIKVVVNNGNIYIETSGNATLGAETVELIDDHYTEITKDVYEEYEFDYDKLIDSNFKPKYASILNPITTVTTGFSKVSHYSFLKKMLLVGFVLASMISLYAVCHVAGVMNIEDKDFVNINKNYLTVNTGEVSKETYDTYRKMDGVEYVIPGDSMAGFLMPLDDYLQTSNAYTVIRASLASKKMITDDMVVYGRNSKKKNEVVIDKLSAENLLKDYAATKMIGVKTPEDFVGRTLRIPNMKPFKIVGLVDQNSPSIYVSKSKMRDILINQVSENDVDAGDMEYILNQTGKNIAQYKFADKMEGFKLVSGREPGDYEAVINYDLRYEYPVGKTYGDTKVNGKLLTVVGYYTSKVQSEKIYTNTDTAWKAYMESCKTLVVSPTDKEATFAKLSEGTLKVTDNYNHDKEAFEKASEKKVQAAIIVAIIMLIVSMIEIYLMLRASFLSRIKEVGVLRAIGVKKRDIYKMFVGEAVAISIMATLPGMAMMAYIINGVSKMPYVGDEYLVTPAIFIVSYLVIAAVNVLSGLLPVMRIIRKTPAQILARNDVN